MILYSLNCAEGHEFEDWFGGSADFDARKAAGDLTCPVCGNRSVSKAIMAPRVAKSAPAPAPMPRCTPGGCAGCAMAGQHNS